MVAEKSNQKYIAKAKEKKTVLIALKKNVRPFHPFTHDRPAKICEANKGEVKRVEVLFGGLTKCLPPFLLYR